MLTPYYPFNRLKVSIMEILFNTYRYKEIPIELLNIILLTFLKESTQISYRRRKREDEADSENESEQVICRCMQILENHMRLKYHFEFFAKFKMEIMFSALSYSQTREEEESDIVKQPEKFVELG